MRFIIAEDEPLARERLRAELETRADCDIVAECADGAAALDALQAHPADVLLLDIQMPVMTGFEVLAALPPEVQRPEIIFITAYDEHALAAFDEAAADYLLKPWAAPRLHAAIDRVAARLTSPAANPPPAIDAILASLLPTSGTAPRITIRDGETLHILRATDIDYIQADGNYLEVHTGDKTILHRETLTAMEALLTPHGFHRLNRSVLVNLERVVRVHAPRYGKPKVALADGTQLPCSCSLKELQAILSSDA